MRSESFVRVDRRLDFLPSSTFSVPTWRITRLLDDNCYPDRKNIIGWIARRLPISREKSGGAFNKAIRRLKNSYKIKAYCIASGCWQPHIRDLQEHVTWAYVREALAFRETQNETHVDAVWRLGLKNSHYRFLQEGLKVSTTNWNRSDARRYVERLIQLADMIERTGDVPAPESLQQKSGRLDDPIGVVLHEDGELLHFQKGHHRIMLAKQLSLAKIDVAIRVAHAGMIERLLGLGTNELRCSSDNSAAIRAAIENHMKSISEGSSPSVNIPAPVRERRLETLR